MDLAKLNLVKVRNTGLLLDSSQFLLLPHLSPKLMLNTKRSNLNKNNHLPMLI
jgi:hypothetical protein